MYSQQTADKVLVPAKIAAYNDGIFFLFRPISMNSYSQYFTKIKKHKNTQ